MLSNSQNFIIFLVLGSIISSTWSSQCETNEDPDRKLEQVLKNNPRLYSLGSVNGKFFLMDNSTKRNWHWAEAVAVESNMKLAEFSTAAEIDFIKNLPFSVLPQAAYWTGGRQRSPVTVESQYIWHYSGGGLVSHSMDFHGDSYFYSCNMIDHYVVSKVRVLHAVNCNLFDTHDSILQL